MDKNLKLQHSSKKSKYTALFMPGFPGEYRDRPLIEDLKRLNFDIYSIVYPGTYKETGTFSPDAINKTIEDAISILEKEKKPILLITYSFSTYFVLPFIEKVINLAGVILFSPIIDFKQTINIDFLAQVKKSSNQDGFNVDVLSFERIVDNKSDSKVAFTKTLKQITDKVNEPIVFVSGDTDKVVKQNEIYDLLQEFRSKNGMNKLMAVKIDNTGHALDGLYENKIIYKLISALVFSLELKSEIPNLSSFLWGAALNYRYSNINSDIDLVLLEKKFNYKDYIRLNIIKNQFNKKNSVNLDLIVNTYQELKTDERIRSNRGPLFVHLLNYYYLPLIKDNLFSIRQINKKVLDEDILFANNINFYKSKKALLNYEPGTSESNWIIKNFLMGCIYYQILVGNLEPDLNWIEKYYIDNKSVHSLLLKCRELKQNGMTCINLNFLKDIVEAHEKLYKKYYASGR